VSTNLKPDDELYKLFVSSVEGGQVRVYQDARPVQESCKILLDESVKSLSDNEKIVSAVILKNLEKGVQSAQTVSFQSLLTIMDNLPFAKPRPSNNLWNHDKISSDSSHGTKKSKLEDVDSLASRVVDRMNSIVADDRARQNFNVTTQSIQTALKTAKTNLKEFSLLERMQTSTKRSLVVYQVFDSSLFVFPASTGQSFDVDSFKLYLFLEKQVGSAQEQTSTGIYVDYHRRSYQVNAQTIADLPQQRKDSILKYIQNYKISN